MAEHQGNAPPRRNILVAAVVGAVTVSSVLLARWGFDTVRLAIRVPPDSAIDELLLAITSAESPLACDGTARTTEPIIDLGDGAVISRVLACDILVAASSPP